MRFFGKFIYNYTSIYIGSDIIRNIALYILTFQRNANRSAPIPGTVLLKGNVTNAHKFFCDLRVANELRVCISGMRTCLDFRLP